VKSCPWRNRVPLATLYCRGKSEGHEGPHQEEVLSPSNVHADVLRAYVEDMAKGGDSWAVATLWAADAAAAAVREGRS
jgi:hypothetical protein